MEMKNLFDATLKQDIIDCINKLTQKLNGEKRM